MKFRPFRAPRSLFLVFDKGDEVIGTLRQFAREGSIQGGRFAAIGALQRATVAFWNPKSRDYEHIEVDEQVEVLSIIGDVAVKGDETKIHAHTVLGRRDGSTVGGHLLHGVVFPTLEMHLVDYGEPLERVRDAETELSLIRIGEFR